MYLTSGPITAINNVILNYQTLIFAYRSLYYWWCHVSQSCGDQSIGLWSNLIKLVRWHPNVKRAHSQYHSHALVGDNSYLITTDVIHWAAQLTFYKFFEWIKISTVTTSHEFLIYSKRWSISTLDWIISCIMNYN